MINIKEDNTELILGLHQEDENDQGVKLTRPYLDIGTTLYEIIIKRSYCVEV